MKNLILSMLLIFTFIYSGCKEAANNDITSPTIGITDEMKPVPYFGRTEGFAYLGGIATCGTGWDKMYYLGEGTASHLGECTIRVDHCYQIQTYEGGSTENGIGVVTAANNDEIHFTYSGTFHFNAYPPTLITYSNQVTITGGTGRFENVQGNVVCAGIQDLTQTPNPTTVTWNGTISY